LAFRKVQGRSSLSDEEIAKIVRWADAGAPRGNPADMPAPREFADTGRWAIGKPDYVVSIPEEYIVKRAAPMTGPRSSSTHV